MTGLSALRSHIVPSLECLERRHQLSSVRPQCLASPVADFDGEVASLNRAWVAHLNRLLDLGALFQEVSSLLDDLSPTESRAGSERLWNSMQIFAYLIVVHHEGWKQFCAGMSIDADEFVRAKPSADTVEHVVDAAKKVAPTPEAALTIMRKRSSQEVQPVTPAGIAMSLRMHVARCEAADRGATL
jgi:hypothetical protein